MTCVIVAVLSEWRDVHFVIKCGHIKKHIHREICHGRD